MLKYKKIISGVLTVALFCSSAIVVNAKNENGKTIDDSVVIENVLNISTINKSIAPYCVDENDYVERLTEYDGYNSLNIVGYRNNSGNNVINIYPYDVKYIQENCLFDKDIRLLSHETTLFSKAYSHKNASNNIEIYLPKNLKDSATLLKRDEKVVLFQPIEAIDSNGTIQNDTEMVYENAFGENTKYTVTSMYDGVGLTIHSKYGFDSPLLFDIEVVGYSVETDANGALVFKDSSTDNAVYKMDSMLAKDTNGNLYVCDMQLVSNDNVHYTLSVELVNDELVGNEIELSSSINDASVLPLIQDAPVYDDFYGMNMGSFKYGVVGQDSMFGVGRLYTKFDLSALTAAGVSYNQVISACYHLPFNSTTATSNMKLEAFLVKESWSEDTIVWDNKPNYLNETLCVVNSSWDEGFGDETVEKSDFYITAAVQAWLQGVTNNGIVIKERTDSGKVTYNTRETTGDTPYLSVVTTNEVSPIEGSGVSEGTYYIKAKINDMFVTASNSSIIQAELLNLPQSQIWELDYMGNGDYTISPLSAPTYYLCATNNLSLSTVCNNQTLWKLRRNWDGSYSLLSKGSNYTKTASIGVNYFTAGYPLILDTDSMGLRKYDDFTLIPNEKGTAQLFGFNRPNNKQSHVPNTISHVNEAGTAMEQMGYDVETHCNKNVTEMLGYMDSASAFMFVGHGNAGMVECCFPNGTDCVSTYLTGTSTSDSSSIADLESLPTNALKKQMFTIFHSCMAGRTLPASYAGDPDNSLIGMAYLRGSHYAVGYTNNIYFDSVGYFNQYFHSSLMNGNTIYEAFEELNNHIEEYKDANGWDAIPDIYYDSLAYRYCLGDNSLVFNLPEYVPGN